MMDERKQRKTIISPMYIDRASQVQKHISAVRGLKEERPLWDPLRVMEEGFAAGVKEEAPLEQKEQFAPPQNFTDNNSQTNSGIEEPKIPERSVTVERKLDEDKVKRIREIASGPMVQKIIKIIELVMAPQMQKRRDDEARIKNSTEHILQMDASIKIPEKDNSEQIKKEEGWASQIEYMTTDLDEPVGMPLIGALGVEQPRPGIIPIAEMRLPTKNEVFGDGKALEDFEQKVARERLAQAQKDEEWAAAQLENAEEDAAILQEIIKDKQYTEEEIAYIKANLALIDPTKNEAARRKNADWGKGEDEGYLKEQENLKQLQAALQNLPMDEIKEITNETYSEQMTGDERYQIYLENLLAGLNYKEAKDAATKEELAVYKYLYRTCGKEIAQTYLQHMEDYILDRKDAQTRAKLDDENVNGFDKFGIRVGSGLNNIGTNIASMPGYVVEVVGQNINNAFSGRNTAVNLDSSASRAMERAGEYAQTALHGTEGVTRFLGESALSIGNNLAVLALSCGNPAIAAPLMGLQAGANTAYDIAQRGGTGFQQLAGGALSGVAEGAGERISLGGLKRIINNPATRSTALGMVKQIGAQVLTEFTEEAATEVMNIVSDVAVMQDQAQLAQFFSEYVEAHPGEEGKAMALVAAQVVQQMTLSGLQGAISGGVMGGGATAYAGIQNRGQGQGTGSTAQNVGTAAQNAVTPQALPIAPAFDKMIDFDGKYFKMGNEGVGGFAEQGGTTEQGSIVPQALPVANANGDSEVKLFDNLDEYLTNPNKLENATPNQMYKYLQDNGYSPQPLSGGGQAGKLFTDGGGFKVNWGGDRILQYHPAGLNHHGGGAYFKISSGPTGTKWFRLDGTLLITK